MIKLALTFFFLSTLAVPVMAQDVKIPVIPQKFDVGFVPATEIPIEHQNFTWKLTNKVNGVETSTGPVKVYNFDGRGWRYDVTTLPNGTEIKLDEMRSSGKTLYFSIPIEDNSQSGFKKYGWVPGYHIVLAGIKPSAK